MSEFQVGEHRYKSSKLNARQQFHIYRRMGPLLSEFARFAPVLQSVNAAALSEPETAALFEQAIQPFLKALSQIPDADCDYVLDRCLSVVQRLSGNGGAAQWADVWHPRTGRQMFEDIEMPEMMRIAAEVLRENLFGFFSMPPSEETNVSAAPQVARFPMSSG